MSAPLVLVVEDEPRIAEVVLAYLAHAGFDGQLIERGDEVMHALAIKTPALMILDLMLPGMDGISLCRDIRKHYSFPIIMVTARVEEVDRLLGFEVGADDYLCKPFSANELIARVRTWIKRTAPALNSSAESAVFYDDAAAQRIYWRDQSISLTPQEYRLFSVLLASPSRIFSRANYSI